MALKMNAVYAGTIVLLLSALLLSGCISSQSTPQDNRLPPATPDLTTRTIAPTTPLVTTAMPPLEQTTGSNRTETITANLPHGISISYPRDWILEETGVNVTRDYGRDVINVANLYSPALPRGRKMAGPNPDPSDNTILTVDIDDAGVTDFEGYFNRVVLALQDEYESMDITSHDLQLRISGYKAYKLDFDAKDLRGKYLFINARETVYIFAFSNPTPYSSEVEEMYRSIIISP